MALFRRRKAEAEMLELIRAELHDVRAEVQATLSETAAMLSGRVRTEIEHRMGEPHALAAGIQSVRNTISSRDAQLAQALGQVVETCDSLAARVQLDRSERAALAEAVSRLTTTIAVAGTLSLPSPGAERTRAVIGGTVEPTRDISELASIDLTEIPAAEVDIDLSAGADLPAATPVAADPPAPRAGRPVHPDGVEVRCRFGDRWVTGFEVCEVIRVDDTTRYRLRRRSDGSVIPTLFDEKDLRFFSTTFVEPK